LLSADLLSYSVAGTVVIPHYLGEHDHPWLRVLLEEHERFIGRPQRELEVRLREPLPCESPPRKLRLAIQVLGRLRPRNRKSAVPPQTGARTCLRGGGKNIRPSTRRLERGRGLPEREPGGSSGVAVRGPAR
jgi:hypothetical protein